MIKYQLICDLTHEFEGWFQTSAAFDAQNQAGLVTCPVCDSVKVRRALMTPNLASPKRRRVDIFKKKALYIYIREMTGTETPYLTKVINILKEEFYQIYNDLYEKGLIDLKKY